MSAAITMRSDFGSDELRRLARTSRDSGHVRRLLSLAAIADGKSRKDAAAVGLMDRQTLRDWGHRFNAEGPAGLIARQARLLVWRAGGVSILLMWWDSDLSSSTTPRRSAGS